MSTPPRPSPQNRPPSASPLTDAELDELQRGLDRVPAPLEPLDVSMLDGFLCGVLIQPRRVSEAQWLPYVTDIDARPLPPRFDAGRIHALALRRHGELNRAIHVREWFDPWVFELEAEGPDTPEPADEDLDAAPPEVDAVYPWVAGFATAMTVFPELMAHDEHALTEPLALIYRHLDPDDLEDADNLLAEIESLEPPADLATAVEELVRATLLLADIGRPLQPAASNARRSHAPHGRRPKGPARR